MDAVFVPPDEQWSGVSPQLRRWRRFLLIVTALPAGVLATVLLGRLFAWWAAAVLALMLVLALAWCWVLLDRNFRSWRYAERAEDLLISRGVLFRELVVVPYGRMQFVDVKAGPVERKFGIATVQLHTAAAATDAKIRGMVPTEAARLRDRLSVLGEARSAGL